MEESDPEAEMSSSTRCTRVFHVQTELRLKSAAQNIVQLTVRWVIGLTGVSAHILAMAESDSEAGVSYSSRCTTGFPVQRELRLKYATQNFVQLTVRWVIGLTGISAQSLAMAESDPEAEMSYSS